MLLSGAVGRAGIGGGGGGDVFLVAISSFTWPGVWWSGFVWLSGAVGLRARASA